MSKIIIECANNEENFFGNLMSQRMVAEQLLFCIDFQIVTNGGQDANAIKMLYKFFIKGIIMSDAFFEHFVDRREFLNKLVIEPLTEIGVSL